MTEEMKNKEEWITIAINGRQIVAQKRVLVIEAADTACIEISHLWYYAHFIGRGFRE